jgi:hypothetical protein
MTSLIIIDIGSWGIPEWGITLAVVGALFTITRFFVLMKNDTKKIPDLEKALIEVTGDVRVMDKTLDKIEVQFGRMLEGSVSRPGSPRVLNEHGEKTLAQSGIKKLVEDRYDDIIEKVKREGPQNAFQAEQAIINVIKDWRKDESLRPKLENGAFLSGESIITVLFVGAIYIRDRILGDLSLNPDDIDLQTPAV